MAGPRRFLRDLMQNERMLAISGSTALMAMCHTALGPVLPIFAKVPTSPRQHTSSHHHQPTAFTMT